MTKKPTWFAMQPTAAGAEILIFDYIGAWGITAKDFIDELKALGEVADITVRINSYGGEVFDGLAIHNALHRHQAQVTVMVDGIAASIASVIAMAGDLVVMPENAMMMVHDPSGLVIGTADDMRDLADALDKMKASLVSVYRAKTGLDDAEIEQIMADETWLTAAEAVEKGFADEVEGKVEMAAMVTAASFDLSKFKNTPDGLGFMAELASVPAAARNNPSGISETVTKEIPNMTTKPEGQAAAAMPAPVDPTTLTAEAAPAAGETIVAGTDMAAQERARISAIVEAGKSNPGNDDLVTAAMADGNQTAGDLALAILERSAAKGPAALNALKAELPGEAADDGVAAAHRAGSVPESGERPQAPVASSGFDVAQFEGMEPKERAEAEWSTNPAVKAEGFTSVEAYAAYLQAVADGLVKVRNKAPAQ